MVEIIVRQQPVLPFSHGIAARRTREEAPVGLMRTFQESALSKDSVNDNRMAWPFIPFRKTCWSEQDFEDAMHLSTTPRHYRRIKRQFQLPGLSVA
jgi:hypothetical protein